MKYSRDISLTVNQAGTYYALITCAGNTTCIEHIVSVKETFIPDENYPPTFVINPNPGGPDYYRINLPANGHTIDYTYSGCSETVIQYDNPQAWYTASVTGNTITITVLPITQPGESGRTMQIMFIDLATQVSYYLLLVQTD